MFTTPLNSAHIAAMSQTGFETQSYEIETEARLRLRKTCLETSTFGMKQLASLQNALKLQNSRCVSSLIKKSKLEGTKSYRKIASNTKILHKSFCMISQF